jgi:hypothetical protein
MLQKVKDFIQQILAEPVHEKWVVIARWSGASIRSEFPSYEMAERYVSMQKGCGWSFNILKPDGSYLWEYDHIYIDEEWKPVCRSRNQ